MKLRDRVAIVTGASRGIGKAIALRFAREGAAVVVAARSESPHPRLPGTIHQTVAEIEADGGRALALRCDVRDESQVEALAARTLETFGGIDILVNNAAATYPASGLEIPLKRWDVVLDVNLRGPLLCTRAVAPTLFARGGGSILNITSGAGDMQVRRFHGNLPSLAYGVSKAALNRLTVGFAAEFEDRGVSVNALTPAGLVWTEGAEAFYGGDAPGSDFVGPENMVEAALHLVRQTPRSLTGWVGTDEALRASTGAW